MSTLTQYSIKTETEYKEKPTHIKAHDKKKTLFELYIRQISTIWYGFEYLTESAL